MKKININFVPDIVNPTPDYYCTWQTQLYATSDGKPEGQRAIIDENSLFGSEKPYGWAYFYKEARGDLILVMDDSWDVPVNGDRAWFGSLILNQEKFPEAVKNSKNNTEALKSLTDRVKSLGWKGLGGWVCAQMAPRLSDADPDEYWTTRLKEADASGFAYWKVDWGAESRSAEFRKMLTEKARKYAPNLTVEQAMIPEIIPVSDVFRTYDVPEIMSVPMTMAKLKDTLTAGKTEEGYRGLIDCEDEAYMAAAGGMAMGIMRHPYSGPMPDGKPDMSFPECHRNVKTKIYEVIRAARFHRMAPAFGIDSENTFIDTEMLTDNWRFENYEAELEAWWLKTEHFKGKINDDVTEKSAPARISRNCIPPEVIPDKNGDVPYMISAKNPNGVYSIATLGRTKGRRYFIPRCDVTAKIGESDTVGAFGEYKNLILETEKQNIKGVYMQDLAADTATDITEDIKFSNGNIIIPGELIEKVGTSAQPSTDTSEPGVVIKLV